MSPKEHAENLISKYGTNSPEKLVDCLDAILVKVPLTDIKGFYQYFQEHHIIYVDSNLEEHEQRFVIAHELGHMLMHKKQNALILDSRIVSSLDKYEQQANSFAVELLLSDKLFKENPETSIYELAARYGVPTEMINLKKLNIKS